MLGMGAALLKWLCNGLQEPGRSCFPKKRMKDGFLGGCRDVAVRLHGLAPGPR